MSILKKEIIATIGRIIAGLIIFAIFKIF